MLVGKASLREGVSEGVSELINRSFSTGVIVYVVLSFVILVVDG